MAAREADAIPLPRDETTPPVTKIYLVIYITAFELLVMPAIVTPTKLSKLCPHKNLKIYAAALFARCFPRYNQVSTTVSGFKDMAPMPSSASHSARSG